MRCGVIPPFRETKRTCFLSLEPYFSGSRKQSPASRRASGKYIRFKQLPALYYVNPPKKLYPDLSTLVLAKYYYSLVLNVEQRLVHDEQFYFGIYEYDRDDHEFRTVVFLHTENHYSKKVSTVSDDIHYGSMITKNQM